MPCVSDTTILAYFRGELDAEATAAIEGELDACSLCRELMLLVAAEWRTNEGALGDALRPDSKVGRYEILEAIGAGAMGVVYRARDPELARDVAIKVMAHPTPQHGERLRSEARAMARLAHRNVVQVFDVGVAGNQTYVAMGLVRGATLREWLSESRTHTDVIEAFAQAADGLAAAHDAGVVHRDFKPDNVLVARDGLVQVGDFGLALAGDQLAAGTPAGTPAYLAPEVRLGTAGPEADQYSFFVALREALTGHRPAFAGGSPVEPARARSPVPLRPRRLARIVSRGLAEDPARRFVSMHDVARELRAVVRAPRRIAIALGAAVAAMTIVAVTVFVVRGGGGETCATAGDEINAVWSADGVTKLRAAFAGIDRPYAAAAGDAVVRMLDDYTESWRESAVGACRATHVDGVQSAELLDRRVACLAGRRADVAAVIARLVQADDDVARRGIDMIAALSPPAQCDDVAVLKDVPLPPSDPAIARSISGVREQLAIVKAHIHAGTFEAGLPIAKTAADMARMTTYKPIVAEALETLGNILISAGKPKDAVPVLEEALLAAEASRHTYVSIAIRVHQVELLGVTLGRYDEARRVAVLGRATAEGIGASLLVAELDVQLGIIDSDTDKHAQALVEYERALPVFLKGKGEQHGDTAHLIGMIGITLDDLGRHDEAIAKLEQDLAMTGRIYGGAHPNVANAMSNLAAHLYTGGDVAAKKRAFELSRKAHAIRVAALPADHQELAMSWSNVGTMLRTAGDLDGAYEHLNKALAIKLRTLGDKHPSTGVSHLSLAEVLFARKDAAGSLVHVEKAVAVFVAALDETHSYTALARAHLGVTLAELERNTDAIAAFELAIPHLKGRPDHHRHLFNLAQLLVETKRDAKRGKMLLEQAEAGAKAMKDQPALDAMARFREKL